MLVTEYKLLNDAGEDTQPTLNELRLSGGTLQMAAGSKIIIEEGGKLIVDEATTITPLSDESYIEIYGTIEFPDNDADLIIHENNGARIVPVFINATTSIVGDLDNRIEIHGSNKNNLVCKIESGAWLRPHWAMDELEIKNGKVEIASSGELHAVCGVDFENVTF